MGVIKRVKILEFGVDGACFWGLWGFRCGFDRLTLFYLDYFLIATSLFKTRPNFSMI